MIKMTIRAEEHLSKRLVEFLDGLEKEGLAYEIEPNSFESNQIELASNLKEAQSEKTKTYTLEEADSILEEATNKYESRTSG